MYDERFRIGRDALRALTLTVLGLASPAAAATQGYTITSFDAIRVDAPITVIVTTGGGVSGRAEGDRDMLDRLRVDVSGRVLTVSLQPLKAGEKRGGAATLRLSTGDLSRVVLTGGGSVAVTRMKGMRGQIMLGGNGDISVESVDVDQLDLGLSGGGRATLAGRAGTATIRVSGPGALAGDALRARQATISNDGPGNVTLAVDVTAKISASGSGDVTISGKAACTADNRGTGRILCGDTNY